VSEIIIHEAVLAELEHQANQGKAVGFIGIDELEKLNKIAAGRIKFMGQRPRASEIKYASLGEIDALIRQLAFDEDATLMTADKVQARIAKAHGMKCLFIPKEEGIRKLKLATYFDEITMSVHLREKARPVAKKGAPGDWKFVMLSEKELTQDEIKEISREIIEEARVRSDGFIEIERQGSTIIQLGKFRIVTTKPPFSDGWEITAVRPVKRLNLNDYKLSDKLKNRIAEQAEGMLIAGAPGHGKTTFAQALAEHYASKEKIVKTVEAPRDLILPETITQYAISHGSPEEIHDILLLSRPDYTIFDEMRNTADFKLFADMRLAGVGMIGVIHGTNPIDAIQRFVGRVELGVIPQVIDTVLFIKNGEINKVLSVKMVVKVPSGMTEADLARPVVTVNNFETGKAEFELYTYGEETVVVPVQETGKKSGVLKLLEDPIKRYFQMYADEVNVEVISTNKAVVFVPEYAIPGIIGKGGSHIEQIEKELGLSIDIEELQGYKGKKKKKR
ncbi:PINc/VapC family ATPase, partial [Candidatus Woesearchaeota archaeon]|nr:PINc/VapC family ATPase [Candidatus Woesearchaeota archaeon]